MAGTSRAVAAQEPIEATMFKKILVPIDVSDPGHSERVVAVARELAKRDGAAVRVLTVLEPSVVGMSVILPREVAERAINEAKRRAGDLAQKIAGRKDGDFNIRRGRVYHEVLEEAREWGADLIVIASHTPGMGSYLLGSNAARIARHATCSVMVLRDGS